MDSVSSCSMCAMDDRTVPMAVMNSPVTSAGVRVNAYRSLTPGYFVDRFK
jgi:hypothetical protein